MLDLSKGHFVLLSINKRCVLFAVSPDFPIGKPEFCLHHVHCKLKRSVSAPTCQFSPAGQSLIQLLLEPFEHNLGQNSSIKRLFQPTL